MIFMSVFAWFIFRSAQLVKPTRLAYQRAMQRRRDRWAASHLDDMRKGKITFFLYLRPFASTGGVHVVRSVSRRKTNGMFFNQFFVLDVRWNDLERLLARQLKLYGPLIGLGRPGEQVGAGRIASNDEDWQQLVKDLAVHARLLFLLPAMDNGTRWEMDLILAQPSLLRKAVFVVPGSGHGRDYLRAARPPGPMSTDDLRRWQIERARDPLVASFNQAGDYRSGGARDDPKRSVAELRRGAIAGLRAIGARAAAARAKRSPTPTLLMLNSDLGVQGSYRLSGYIGMSFSLFAVGNKYLLDLKSLRHTLAGLMEEAEDPSLMREEEDPGRLMENHPYRLMDNHRLMEMDLDALPGREEDPDKDIEEEDPYEDIEEEDPYEDIEKEDPDIH
jgi:hypothetical protein